MASFYPSSSSSIPNKSHNKSISNPSCSGFRSALVSLVCRWCCWRSTTSFSSFFFFLLLLSSHFSSVLTFSVASHPIHTLYRGSHTHTGHTVLAPSPAPSPKTIYLGKAGAGNNISVGNHHQHHHRITLAISLSTSATLFACLLIMSFLKFLKFKIRRRSKRVEDAQEPSTPNCTTTTTTGSQKSDSSGASKNNDKKIVINNPCSSSFVPSRFTWEEIERLTMNFSSRVIGEGGFSNVYLSHFSDSTLGALKIHTGSSERLNRMFKQELEVLLHVRHDNIVNLLGYCDEREEGALLFEYVSNGSLHEKLHEIKGGLDSKVLTWKSRMSIAFQLAKAIEYLHDACKPQIVHGDIKSSNVLLDGQLNCKLCDFGFSKMGFSSTVMPSSMSPLMGSPGYMDPLYLRTGIASKKNDVYSFGVIVLEMITGIEAFCSEKEEILTSIAGPIIKDANRVAEMVDPRVRMAGDLDIEEAKIMASISATCLRQQPSLRPSMTEILRTMTDRISF